jgi:L-lactate dehydrogenase complex protein LldG
MTARSAILASVRTGLGPNRHDAAAIAVEALALLADPDEIRPALSNPDPVVAFAASIVGGKVGATLDRIESMAELPASVARYLASHGLPPALWLQPDPALHGLDWQGFTLSQALRPDETAALGLARWGIAETGSLVFHSAPETAVLGHFLPMHHIAAVRASTILRHLEDYAGVAGPAPRNVNLITGASGTTDIEGSYVRGAHGPGFLHVVLVEDGTR